MDRLDSKARANVSRIKDLLNESIEGATVETTKLPDYQQKFKIDANGKRVFLIVSLEYLEDRDEQQIRRAFERYILPTLLTSDPGERFLLSGQGLNRIQSDLVAS